MAASIGHEDKRDPQAAPKSEMPSHLGSQSEEPTVQHAHAVKQVLHGSNKLGIRRTCAPDVNSQVKPRNIRGYGRTVNTWPHQARSRLRNIDADLRDTREPAGPDLMVFTRALRRMCLSTDPGHATVAETNLRDQCLCTDPCPCGLTPGSSTPGVSATPRPSTTHSKNCVPSRGPKNPS